MSSPSHGLAGRISARIDRLRRDDSAESEMHRMETHRSYWAQWQSRPSQLTEILSMYSRETELRNS